jgi:hypothetical protein
MKRITEHALAAMPLSPPAPAEESHPVPRPRSQSAVRAYVACTLVADPRDSSR